MTVPADGLGRLPNSPARVLGTPFARERAIGVPGKEGAFTVAPLQRPLFIALFLGLLLTVLSAVADAPVALASLLAAFLVGVAFPDQAVVAGGAVMAPQVLGAVVIGVGESIGLALVA